MKVTVAPDSLKESLSAQQAANAIGRGLQKADPSVQLELVPIADGGEGTVDALVAATGGRKVIVPVVDPLGRPVHAALGLLGDGRVAAVEMAAASGLALLAPRERNPMLTSTRGTGQLVRRALELNVEQIIVCIGGSATVDCGAGMAAELGARFLDSTGTPIDEPSGGRLQDVRKIDLSGLDPRLERTRITVACDVTNPLVGPKGAAPVYAPQKGADDAMVTRLSSGIGKFANVIRKDLGKDVRKMPGGGAAGGLGAGLSAFMDAELKSGIEVVMEAVRLRERMRGSALVITAEGRIDGQSAFGKAPAGVAALARELGIPVVALGGSLGPDYEKLYDCGIAAVFSICDRPMPIETAFAEAEQLVERAAASLMRFWKAAAGRGKRRG
jgi:glycerate kinase